MRSCRRFGQASGTVVTTISVLPRASQSPVLSQFRPVHPLAGGRPRAIAHRQDAVARRAAASERFPDRILQEPDRDADPLRPTKDARCASGAVVRAHPVKGVRYETRSRLPRNARKMTPRAIASRQDPPGPRAVYSGARPSLSITDPDRPIACSASARPAGIRPYQTRS